MFVGRTGSRYSRFGRKSGSSATRAERARQGHRRRRGKLFTSSHYRGSSTQRTKPTWIV